MGQIKFYKYVIWGLLTLNLAILAFFVFNRPRPPHHRFHQQVVEMLELDDQQARIFQGLAQGHNEQVTRINERQHNLISPYFESIVDNSKAVEEGSVLIEYQNLEGEKLKVTNRHFQDIKAILTPEQLPHFENFVNEFIKRILSKGKKNERPPKDLN